MPIKMRYYDPKLCEDKLMSWTRKYNGFGFIWTGQEFLSLNYKLFNAPKEVIDFFPKEISIQGEIWKDDSLSKVSSVITRNNPNVKDWNQLVFFAHYIFPSRFLPVEYQREVQTHEVNLTYKEMRLMLEKHQTDYYKLSPLFSFKSNNYDNLLGVIRDNKWEGIVIQNLNSYYEDDSIYSRSKNTLKIKPDSESNTVIYKYTMGKTGRKIGFVGSFLCFKVWTDEVLSFPNGQEKHIGKLVKFHVAGLTDHECSHVNILYPEGKRINFTFKYLSDDGVPQNCNLLREEDE